MKKNGWKPMLLLVCISFAGGCAGGPDAQLSSCQQDKDQLLATIREQRDANRKMNEQVASLEKRLDESEKALAQLPANTRISTRPVEKARLPWKSPAGKGESKSSSPATGGTKTGKTSPARQRQGVSLASLAERDDRLELDPKTGAARLPLDLPFEDGSARLTGEGRQQLDKVAKLLKSDAAADSRIIVSAFADTRAAKSGQTEKQPFESPRQLAAARAEAVAAYLDSHGIDDERLDVNSTLSRATGSRGGQPAGGVEIQLLPPEAQQVQWASQGTLRR